MEVLKCDRCYGKVHDPMGPPNTGVPRTLSRGLRENLQLGLT